MPSLFPSQSAQLCGSRVWGAFCDRRPASHMSSRGALGAGLRRPGGTRGRAGGSGAVASPARTPPGGCFVSGVRGAGGVFLVKNPGALTRGSEPGAGEHAPHRSGPSEARVWACGGRWGPIRRGWG